MPENVILEHKCATTALWHQIHAKRLGVQLMPKLDQIKSLPSHASP